MARTTIEKITDDLTGNEISADDLYEFKVDFQGKSYTLDTTRRNAEIFTAAVTGALKGDKRLPHFANTTGKTGTRRTTNLETYGFSADEVRAYGVANGLAKEQGRISQAAYDGFKAAQK